MPVPPQDAQQRAAKAIGEAFGAQVTKARTPQEKQAIAKKLLEAGVGERKDPAARYVLLTLARDDAVAAGDVAATFDALDAIEKSYSVDSISLKDSALSALVKTAPAPAGQKAVAEHCLKLADEAVRADRYDLARQLSELAATCAQKAADSTLLTVARQRRKEVGAVEQAFHACSAATAALRRDPADPAANLTVGKFRCFVKGDWEAGLPLLALGQDPALKALAEKERKGAADPEGEAALGDDWWKFAESQPADVSGTVRLHAATWYKQAVEHLSGLAKAKVQGRIAQCDALLRSREQSERPGDKRWTLLFRGSDPATWNTDSAAESAMATPVARAPAEVRWLRMKRVDNGEYVIIAINKDSLEKDVTAGEHSWNGAGTKKNGHASLGIANHAWKATYRDHGQCSIDGYRGWGWGTCPPGLKYPDAAFCWNGEKAEATAVEISVCTGQLLAEEAGHVLN